MSLPLPWIEHIFSKLTLIYGQQFLNRWSGLEIAAVKTDWSHELAGFSDHPKAIAYALENLPTDRPPTVLEFRAVARRSPREDQPKLESPKATPSVIAAELAKLSPTKGAVSGGNGKDWAHRIIARHEAGERIKPCTLRFAHEALGRMGAQ